MQSIAGTISIVSLSYLEIIQWNKAESYIILLDDRISTEKF